MKDPYIFDFIHFKEDMLERDIEYSLRDMSKPIGISEYKITSSLSVELEKELPYVEDIQKRIKNNQYNYIQKSVSTAENIF